MDKSYLQEACSWPETPVMQDALFWTQHLDARAPNLTHADAHAFLSVERHPRLLFNPVVGCVRCICRSCMARMTVFTLGASTVSVWTGGGAIPHDGPRPLKGRLPLAALHELPWTLPASVRVQNMAWVQEGFIEALHTFLHACRHRHAQFDDVYARTRYTTTGPFLRQHCGTCHTDMDDDLAWKPREPLAWGNPEIAWYRLPHFATLLVSGTLSFAPCSSEKPLPSHLPATTS